jgi:RNA-dependent RNA polymerase
VHTSLSTTRWEAVLKLRPRSFPSAVTVSWPVGFRLLVQAQARQQTKIVLVNFIDSTRRSYTSSLHSHPPKTTHISPITLSYHTNVNYGASPGGCNHHSMNRGNGAYQRGRGRGRGGAVGSRDNRAYSSSSGSSSGQYGHGRPVMNNTSAGRGRVTPPNHANVGPARVDSPMTPAREQSSYTLNGHSISETYTPSGSGSVAATTPPRSYNTPSSPTPARGNYSGNTSARGNYSGNTPGHQNAMLRPMTRNGQSNWAALQEYKIKILGLPKSYWTKAVYKALSQYGTVVRIEMVPGSQDNSAWVSFQ